MKKALLSPLEYNKVPKKLESNIHWMRNKHKHKISHGRTRNYTEKTEAETRKENQAEELATELHGIKTHLSEPEA